MVSLTKEIVERTKLPVTVKTRLGWDEKSIKIVEVAERLQDVGIKAISIHGRTRAQMYKGDADWTQIAAIKNNQRMHIPVFGNGDVNTPERAIEMRDKFGLDGAMIGRASIGNPWFFREVKPEVEIIGLQPVEGSVIPGIRRWPDAYMPKIYDRSQVDRVIDVGQSLAESTMRRLAELEGILCGVSSGGNVAAALQISREIENATIVAIICDRGDRYLSTGVFSKD